MKLLETFTFFQEWKKWRKTMFLICILLCSSSQIGAKHHRGSDPQQSRLPARFLNTEVAAKDTKCKPLTFDKLVSNGMISSSNDVNIMISQDLCKSFVRNYCSLLELNGNRVELEKYLPIPQTSISFGDTAEGGHETVWPLHEHGEEPLRIVTFCVSLFMDWICVWQLLIYQWRHFHVSFGSFVCC